MFGQHAGHEPTVKDGAAGRGTRGLARHLLQQSLADWKMEVLSGRRPRRRGSPMPTKVAFVTCGPSGRCVRAAPCEAPRRAGRDEQCGNVARKAPQQMRTAAANARATQTLRFFTAEKYGTSPDTLRQRITTCSLQWSLWVTRGWTVLLMRQACRACRNRPRQPGTAPAARHGLPCSAARMLGWHLEHARRRRAVLVRALDRVRARVGVRRLQQCLRRARTPRAESWSSQDKRGRSGTPCVDRAALVT